MVRESAYAAVEVSTSPFKIVHHVWWDGVVTGKRISLETQFFRFRGIIHNRKTGGFGATSAKFPILHNIVKHCLCNKNYKKTIAVRRRPILKNKMVLS